jgi:hypothetical protein
MAKEKGRRREDWRKGLLGMSKPVDADGVRIFRPEQKLMPKNKWQCLTREGKFNYTKSSHRESDEWVCSQLRERSYFIGREPFPFFNIFRTVNQGWKIFGSGDVDDRVEKYNVDHPDRLRVIFLDYIQLGLEALAEENDNPYIKLAAGHLHRAYDSELVDYHLSADTVQTLVDDYHISPNLANNLAPTPDTPVYVNNDSQPGGIVVISIDWLKAAVEKPHQALVGILGAASNYRDDVVLHEWRGVSYVSSRTLKASAEVKNTGRCRDRQEALQAELLIQIYRKDQDQYHVPLSVSPNLDYLRTTKYRSGTKSLSWLFYDDPPPSVAGSTPEPEPDRDLGDHNPWGRII